MKKEKGQFVEFTPNSIYSFSHLYVTGSPSWYLIPHWAWYYTIDQIKIGHRLRGRYLELLTTKSDAHDSRTICGSRISLEVSNWLLSSWAFGWVRHPACPVHLFTTDARKHTAVCLVRRLYFIWSQGLTNYPRLVVSGQSTRWRACGVCLRSDTFVGTHFSRENNA